MKEVDWTNDPAKMDNYFFEYGVTGEDRIFAIMNDSAWTNVNNVTWRNTTPHIFDHALDMSWAIETVENYESGVSLVFRPDFYVRYVPHMNNEIQRQAELHRRGSRAHRGHQHRHRFLRERVHHRLRHRHQGLQRMGRLSGGA